MIPMPALGFFSFHILSCSHIYHGLYDFSKVFFFMSWHSKMSKTHLVFPVADPESAIPPRTPVVHCTGESTRNHDLGKKYAQVSNMLPLSYWEGTRILESLSNLPKVPWLLCWIWLISLPNIICLFPQILISHCPQCAQVMGREERPQPQCLLLVNSKSA